MNLIRRIFTRTNNSIGSRRFERYYGRIAQSGSGFPTADEARRDLQSYDRTALPFGWPH